ncbi:hypothetical protein, partial [Brucella melitensis]|uniref:hypothetical protein n=1 Tax=Brucella melitensis TaxID=29459 RepID=UPI001AEE8D87
FCLWVGCWFLFWVLAGVVGVGWVLGLWGWVVVGGVLGGVGGFVVVFLGLGVFGCVVVVGVGAGGGVGGVGFWFFVFVVVVVVGWGGLWRRFGGCCVFVFGLFLVGWWSLTADFNGDYDLISGVWPV